MFIAVISLLSYVLRWRNAHYYLAILTVFCIWPAGKTQSICRFYSRATIFLFVLYQSISLYRHIRIICFWLFGFRRCKISSISRMVFFCEYRFSCAFSPFSSFLHHLRSQIEKSEKVCRFTTKKFDPSNLFLFHFQKKSTGRSNFTSISRFSQLSSSPTTKQFSSR